MTGYFEIETSWPEQPVPDATDVAQIAIRVGGDYLTRVADLVARTNRDFFRGSATTLAFWLADNWWRLRHEPLDPASLPSADWRLRHELSSASGGTLWPPLMIYSGGERVIIAPILSRRPPLEPLQYLDTRVRSITANQFELGIDEFFNAVLEQCARSADAQTLAALVGQLVTERREPELAAWRKLEARLGFDTDEAPDAVVETMLKLAPSLGDAEIEEAASAYPGPKSGEALQVVLEASKASHLEIDLSNVDRIDPTRDTRPYPSPWQMAESAAAQVRDMYGINHGPLGNETFANLLLTRWETLKTATATTRALPYAARLRTGDTREKIAIQSTNPIDLRFEIARLLGDAIWTRDSAFGPVSDARTDRQKFQRAFAQSLLCPYEDLRQFVDLDDARDEQIRDAAEKFGVHFNVVRNLLAYKGALRETLEDQLETA
jgi:hypothetical protein